MRFLLRLCLIGLLSHSVLGASLYVQFEGIVPDAWNPAYGYFLKNSHILKNARLNGCYGSKETLQEINMGNTTLAVAKESYRHSTFESPRPGEYTRNVENRLSYPLEPVAAFIQWLYPSPARTSLGHNANSHDPLGVWARMVNSDDATQKARALETMGEFIILIRSLYDKPTLDDDAQKEFSRKFNYLFNAEEVPLKRIDAFKEIVFKAVQAERFDENIKKLYPAGMARYTLLAYLTDVISNREDLVSIYKKAGLIDDGYIAPPIPPLTKALFDEKKLRIQSPPAAGPVALSDLVLYLQGRDRYDSAIPKEIPPTTAIIEVEGRRFSYADCGETALMNFFLIALWKDGAINPAHLDHLAEAFPNIRTIRDHFARFNTLELLASKESHNNFAAIVANKNSEDLINPLQRIRYNRGNVAELAGATPSLLNLFSVLFSTAASIDSSPHKDSLSTLMTPWATADLSTVEDQNLVLQKWKAICSLLSRPDLEHVITTTKSTTKKIDSTVEFSLNGQDPFSYSVSKSHFQVFSTLHYSQPPKLTLSESNTSKEIIRAAFHSMCNRIFGNQTDPFFVKLLIDHTMFEEHTFRHFLKQQNSRVFIGILDAILYRSLGTFGYDRMDDLWIHGKVSHQFQDHHPSGKQSAIDLYVSSAGKDFLKLQYLPYVFAEATSPAFTLCQEVMEKLEDHGEYKSYVDGLMNSSNPKKWEFAAFHGIQKPTGPYIRGLRDFDKITFDAHHPLIHAIKNGHLKIVQHLTGQGKLPYWKAKAESTSVDRPVLGVLGKCSSLDMVKFLVENDPNLLSEVADHPKQYFLKHAKTPEIFAYLQEKLGLDTHELYSFANIYGGEQNVSILDVMMMEGSIEQREHIVSIFPDIPVTDLTFQEMQFGFSPKVLATFIRNFKGDWNALTISGRPALEFFLQFPNRTSLQIVDRILPKFNKSTLVKRHGEGPLVNGRSPYVLVAEYANSPSNLRNMWMLARHQFPWPAHIPLTQYSNINKSIKAIRWLFKQQTPGEVPPTLDEINGLESTIVPDSRDPMHEILKADFDGRRRELNNFLEYRELLDGLSSTS